MEKERIQKVLASTGEYSRRQVEAFIDERKIKVNGVVVTAKGMKVHPIEDRIQVAGKAFQYKSHEPVVALLLNKPRAVMVTRQDPEGRKTVFDLLPKKYQNLKPVGRLDFNSQGALILTNDGDLILKLTHPRYHLAKIYEVKLSSLIDEKQISRLEKGILLDGVRTLPAKVKVIRKSANGSSVLMTLEEGKNRQIRRMCQAVGLTVKELRRVAIGPIKLKNLRSGQFRSLNNREVKLLIQQTENPSM